MTDEQTIQTIRLRLLAFVLALALTWYAMNPAPGPVRRVKRDDGPPDEKRREAKSPPGLSCVYVGMEIGTMKSALDPLSPAGEDMEDLEWPEVIDVN